jgi:hypothetical protein
MTEMHHYVVLISSTTHNNKGCQNCLKKLRRVKIRTSKVSFVYCVQHIDNFKLHLETLDDEILNDDSGDETEEEAIHLPCLTDDEFLQKYRMSKERFFRKVDLIQDYHVFKSRERR